MRYDEFLLLTIEDGIEAARLDYARPEQQQKRDGSILGFEECRDRDPLKLAALLQDAQAMTRRKRGEHATDYWYWRCREAEIEWVCNVVSAICLSQGLPPIITPTVRGMKKALEVLGVQQPRLMPRIFNRDMTRPPLPMRPTLPLRTLPQR
jgi:hypothetical protein